MSRRSTLVAGAMLLVACGGAEAEGRAAPVKVGQAVVLEAAQRLWVPGTVLSRQDARVGVEVSGRLVAVVEPGTRVGPGDVLARVDDQRWRFQLAEAESRIARLEVRMQFLDKEVDRLTRLNAQENVARSRLDEVEAERAMTAQDRQLALTEKERADYLIDRASITAPFPGQVVERLADVGEYAQEGSAVVRLVNLSQREVRAQAPLRMAPLLRELLRVPVRTEGGTVEVPISTIIPVGDLDSRSFEIRLRVDELDWVIGAPVEVGLPSASQRAGVAVPRDALVLRDDEVMVFRVNGDGAAERIVVEAGRGLDGLVEVEGGISAGDRVVIRGAETLRDGQPVEVL